MSDMHFAEVAPAEPRRLLCEGRDLPSVRRRTHLRNTLSTEVERLRTQLGDALRAAYAAGLGVPADLQPLVRDHAKAWRLAGGEIGTLLVEVKQLVRDTTGNHEPVYVPKIVGWSIAGYFEGTTPAR